MDEELRVAVTLLDAAVSKCWWRNHREHIIQGKGRETIDGMWRPGKKRAHFHAMRGVWKASEIRRCSDEPK